MASNIWLPPGYPLPDGSICRKLVAAAQDWQIVRTNADSAALLVWPALRDKWVAAGLVGERLFDDLEVSGTSYSLFAGKRGYLIASMQHGPYPQNSTEAHAFAISLRETRAILGSDVPLHDAVYIEQISRLLPTYTATERLDDPTVAGTWLTAGVRISTESFHRLCELLEWMDRTEVEAVVEETGLAPGNGSHLYKARKRAEADERALRRAADASENKPLPDRPFSLPGRPGLEGFFNEHVVDILANEERYRRMGIEFPAAIVLHGPPGCGKTFAVERLVEYLDWPSHSIDSGSIGSSYIHGTSKKIAEVFDEAIYDAPSVVVMDEMEAFLANRNFGLNSGVHHVEEVAEFLRRIPEARENRVLVIAMTNMLESIDPAILRRGRFDHIIRVDMPTKEEVQALLSSLLSKLPVLDDVDLDALSERLKERPLSDVAFVVKEAGRIAVKTGKDAIDRTAMEAACASLPSKDNAARKIGFER